MSHLKADSHTYSEETYRNNFKRAFQKKKIYNCTYSYKSSFYFIVLKIPFKNLIFCLSQRLCTIPSHKFCKKQIKKNWFILIKITACFYKNVLLLKAATKLCTKKYNLFDFFRAIYDYFYTTKKVVAFKLFIFFVIILFYRQLCFFYSNNIIQWAGNDGHYSCGWFFVRNQRRVTN
jgi:hypothetical protein